MATNRETVAFGAAELICVTSDARIRLSPSGADAPNSIDIDDLRRVAEDADVRFSPLFGDVGRVRDQHPEDSDSFRESDLLARYFHVDAPEEQLDALAERLRTYPGVEAAYVKPGVELATALDEWVRVAPSADEPPSVTPDFSADQGYLAPAPVGVDAGHAWSIAGGRGDGVKIIDCEWGWRLTHEDLIQNSGGVVVGSPSSDTNHGTAVIGEIGGDANGFGVVGIAPRAVVSAASFSLPTAQVIARAALRLRAGDILLLEIHRPGPRSMGSGQQGFIAVEWWPDDFLAIRSATDRGIVVIEAAGNGAENLDHPIYDQRLQGFPAWWRNPFRRRELDSKAVIVGAGAPPPGTHGMDHGPDRSRLGFSNFGLCVDTQGWGREVTTTGYGDLQGGSSPDFWYTQKFSGTSSASPIVVGAVACVQGILRAASRAPLGPLEARKLLRNSGSPQTDAPGRPTTQRIGNRPNLKQLIPAALGLREGGAQD